MSAPDVRAPVAITGLGAVSAVGRGVESIWRALAAGQDGIRPIERFSTEGFSVRHAAMVRDSGAEGDSRAERPSRATQDLALDFAVTAAREALSAARLADSVPRDVPSRRVAIAFGTSLATHPEGIHRLAELLGEALSAGGPRLTISTACASSANALGVGRELLLSGAADVVVAGGSDALTEEIFAGFHNLGLLSPAKCAPFSDPPGTTLGEGAGFVILERASHAAKRGVAPLAWLSGMGLSCDAYHATSPDPTGAGVARAASAALADAGLSAADIDYVNAHGTGTEANDPAEWRGIQGALGERARSVPVSATKSVIGHGQGAAGVLEIIATLLAMERGAIPQTLNHTRPRPRCPEDPVAQSSPRAHPVAHALCNSSAFGGANAMVTIDAAASPAPPRAVQRRPVWLLGAGLLLPGAADVASLLRLERTGSLTGTLAKGPSGAASGPVATPDLRGVDLRGFDPLSRHMTLATAAALRDAGLSIRGAARDRTGLFAALVRISPASAHELDDSVKERGLLRLSAPAFTRVVLNASTGACARALQLRGPTTTLTTGDGAGLTALVLAAEHLSLRDDADALCVAAADEIDRDDLPGTVCESGACLVLGVSGDVRALHDAPAGPRRSAGPEAPSTTGTLRARVSGWGLAGPGEKSLAIERALAMVRPPGEALSRGPVGEAESPRGPRILAPSAHPLVSAAIALHRLRAGERRAVVVAHDSGSCAAAVLLETPEAQ